ncbi:DNRLRE domain-containing protein [Frankia sp. AiPs1]|uniref:DNRLRE domain-containing protein n=1 Tax=Frankia sp. AiPs1 TaxID=573493 RepID=UPI002042E737|nr:DNRLRE domain-containing protein [Frankia sp. AiPs1]MCM3923179.1 DNRLRE domain-containing protein [Frankia sp. AiPs1]
MTKPLASVSPPAVASDGEIRTWRTARSDTYLVKGTDGRRHYKSVFSSIPMNWKDPTGAWQPIDNTLKPVAAGSKSVRTSSGPVIATLPSDLSTAPIQISKGTSTVSFQLRGAASTAGAVSGDTETYKKALPGVDVHLRTTASGVKEDLVLAGKDSPSTFTYDLTVPAGTHPVLTPGGAIAVVDGKGATVGVLPAPTLADASKKSTGQSVAASYSLAATGAKWTLKISVDKAWLADPARVFPVTVDPTYTYTDDGSTGNISCQLGSGSEASTNECGGTSVEAGGSANHYRGLFQFALTLPRDAAIDAATLTLNEVYADNTSFQQVEVHRMTRPWTSSATWNTYDGTHSWTTAGGDYDSGVQSVTSVGGSSNLGPYYWGLQQLVSDWATGAQDNNGIIVRATSENGSQTNSFGSQNASSGMKPQLSVVWDPRAGINDANTYIDTTLTDRQQARVNVGSGDLVLTSKEYALAGPSPALSISRVYNSTRSYTAGSLGYGWTLDTGHDVRAYYGTDGYIHYLAPTGRAYLLKNYGGTGTSGTFTTLTLDADGTVGTGNAVTIKYHASGLTMSFRGSDGMLTSIADRNGNTQTFSYSSTIFSGDGFPYLNSITDAAGRTITVNHSYLNTGLSDTSSRSTAYTYQNNADLIDASDLNGKHTTYSYDGNHRPTQITTPAGHIVKISYDSSNRVTSIIQVTNVSAGTGPTTTFTYHGFTGSTGNFTASTDVTDPNGHVTTYTYDTADRVLSTTDALSHTTQATYNPNDDQTSATDALGSGHTTTYGYDTSYNPTSVVAPTGATQNTTYPTTGTTANPLYLPSSVTDPQGKKQTLTYEGPGNLTKSQDTTGGTSGVATVISYQGDTPPTGGSPLSCGAKPGEPCQTTDGNNHGTLYAYNTTGDLTSMTPPSPQAATSFGYDSLSRLTSRTDGNGKHTTYTYDSDNRTIKTTYDGGTATSYTYDDDGNLTAEKELNTTGGTTREVDYTYDTLARRTSQSVASGAVAGEGTITYGYDAASSLTSYADPGGTVGYGYDNADRLTSATEPGGSCSGYNLSTPTYPPASSHCILIRNDNNGHPTLIYYPGGNTQTVSYDASQRPAAVAGAAAGGSGSMFNLSYTYTSGVSSSDGELVSQVADSGTDGSTHTTAYSYDNLNRPR